MRFTSEREDKASCLPKFDHLRYSLSSLEVLLFASTPLTILKQYNIKITGPERNTKKRKFSFLVDFNAGISILVEGSDFIIVINYQH
jgi:hypothetical protein